MSPASDPDDSKEQNPQSAPLSRLAVDEQFLEAYKSRTSSDAAEFMDRLQQQTQEAMGQRSTMQVPFNVRDGFLESSVTKWMDQLFDRFESYGHTFNQTAISEDLKVSCQRPEASREAISYNAYKEPDKTVLLLRGTLSTPAWTVVVRGTKERIEVYLVPAERALTITRTQAVYAPRLVLTSTWEKGRVLWRRSGELVPESQIPSIAQEVFADLVKFTSGHAEDQDPNSPANASPNIDGPSFFDSTGQNTNPYVQDFLRSERGGQALASPTTQETSTPSHLPPDWERSIPELCDMLLEAVDIELESITASCTASVSNQDTEKAQQCLESIKSVKDFRNQVSDLISAWQRLKAD